MQTTPKAAGRLSLPSKVANAVRMEIVDGTLRPGDKLPTEQDYGVRYKVSRAVVREAIAKLRHEGLVISRQGSGAYVAMPEAAKSLTLEPDSLTRPENYRHLYDLRLILETGAADMAARNCTADDIAKIGDCIVTMAEVRDHHSDYVEADISFHRAVAAATKNPFVSLFIGFVDVKLKESIALALSSLDFASTSAVSIREHRVIFEAIRARDPTASAAAMQAHLQNSSRRLGL